MTKSQKKIPFETENRESLRNTKSRLVAFLILAVLVIAAVFSIISGINVFAKNDPKDTRTDFMSDIRALGPENAEVTVTEYSDFGCITCKAWHDFGIRDEILEKYGNKVRFIWRDFPVITANSKIAAEAGLCAHDQQKFWQYHDVLFENSPALDANDLKNYAATLGLDSQQFNQCLDSGLHTNEVELGLQKALDLGFRGTPSFIVNEVPLIGPPSFEQLSTIIDSILEQNN